jgi:hypothetical protein
VALGLLITAPAFTTEAVENLGAHRIRGMDEFQRVIETRCTVCHSRERVDVAIKEQQDREKIEQRMLERGAVLTERDKQVLGTFWGNPLKEADTPAK